MSQIAGEPGTQDFVEVRLPAAGAYLSVLRTATAGLAARLDFTLDEIEDLRIAVDEACAILLQQAVPGSVLSCVFRLVDDSLEVTVSAPTTDGRAPERDTFAWTVLSALAGKVDSTVADDRTVSISLLQTARRGTRAGVSERGRAGAGRGARHTGLRPRRRVATQRRHPGAAGPAAPGGPRTRKRPAEPAERRRGSDAGESSGGEAPAATGAGQGGQD